MLQEKDNIKNPEIIEEKIIENTEKEAVAEVLTTGIEENKKQKDALEKEKMTLESNIARREKLLSNPGYVNNAPKNLVEEEKIKLENEKKELAIILEKLK